MRNEIKSVKVLEVDVMRGERSINGESVKDYREGAARVSPALVEEAPELRQKILSGLDKLAPDDRVWIETVFGLREEEEAPLIVPLDLAFKSEKTKRILRRLRTNR